MIQGQVVWFEIPVRDLDKAMRFYSEVLSVKIEKSKFIDLEYGVFNKEDKSIKGVLVGKENKNPSEGIVLFFYVIDMSDSLRSVVKLGGKIVIEKTLLKQKTKEGYTLNNNLIDDNMGYYSEFTDCDGNRICLYSNS
jgi:uncharacterized protein